jgi:DNA methyltransferase 1-associated protein 1
MTRKKYVASLEDRTPEQIAEEEALYIEIKRLEQNERKFKKDRDELLRTLAGIDSGLPDVVEDEGALLGLTSDMKKKKRGAAAMDVDSPSTPSVLSLSAPMAKRPQTAKSAAYGTLPCIHRAS